MEAALQSISWGQNEIQSTFADKLNLQEIIVSIEGELWNRGHVVCEVHVNGMYLSEEDESRMAETTVAEIQSLEVRTRTPQDLIRESLDSLTQLLPWVRDSSLRLADELRLKKFLSLESDLKNVLEATTWVTDALNLLKPTIVRLSGDDEFEQHWRNLEDGYGKVVREMLIAFEKLDWILLGDILEYDLSSCMNDWLELLGRCDKITLRTQG